MHARIADRGRMERDYHGLDETGIVTIDDSPT
jgi:hypothetical protein